MSGATRELKGGVGLTGVVMLGAGTAIGVSIVLQTAAMLIWGRNYMTFPQLLFRLLLKDAQDNKRGSNSNTNTSNTNNRNKSSNNNSH